MTSPLPANDQPRYDLFVFGDSLSDTGNLFRQTFGFVPPSPPYFNGRVSNGRVAVETLALQLGINLSLETNFAVAGARTGRTNVNDNSAFQFGGLLDQVDRFKTEASNLGADAQDLYFVWAGANDFSGPLPDPTAAVNTAVNNIVTTVTSLVELGAKNIVVAKTPNLGRVPLSLQANQLEPLTALSNAFNAALEAALTPLEQPNGTNIILTDLFAVTEAVAQDPAAFGFSNTTTPYLNGLIPADPAADPNQFFFWDLVHPTTRAHDLFAATFRRTLITDIKDTVIRVGTEAPDRLVGFSGNDSLSGRAGADYLEGNIGNDQLAGGSQADSLLGGSQNDQLTGGGGQDFLQGGLGQDLFIYQNADHGRDTIADFQIGRDKIDVQRILDRPNYDKTNRFAAYIQLIPAGSNTVVRIDGNGDTSGGFRPLAQLLNVNADDLSAASFLLTRFLTPR
jgi:phospholipase/lecithinase/hemolysin